MYQLTADFKTFEKIYLSNPSGYSAAIFFAKISIFCIIFVVRLGTMVLVKFKKMHLKIKKKLLSLFQPAFTC